MNIHLLFALFLCLSTVATPSVGLESDEDTSVPTQGMNLKNTDHMIMVGFPDQSINRVEASASPATYRRRGAYQSSTWSRRITSQIADDYHLTKMAEWPMTEVAVHCAVYQVPDNQSVKDTLNKLAKDTRLDIVQPMNVFSTQASRQNNDPYFKLQSNLQRMEIDQAHGIATGKDISIAIIDTGADLKHPDLSGQIINEQNFAEEISPGFSDDKHGTAVAGIIAAKKDNGIGISGVAPNAKLMVYKACWPNQKDSIDAVCNSYTLALAINMAIKSGAQILNMSLSGPQDPLLEILLKKAIKNGMVIVAANVKQPAEGGNFPASMHDVISVRSLAKSDAKDKSYRDAISAPGEKILTTVPYGTYDFISGSSISAAEVSGIIALLMEIKPDLKLPEIKSILEQSQLHSSSSPFQGINANNAVLALCETATCPEHTLSLAVGNNL